MVVDIVGEHREIPQIAERLHSSFLRREVSYRIDRGNRFRPKVINGVDVLECYPISLSFFFLFFLRAFFSAGS